jgi:hypothetical protein
MGKNTFGSTPTAMYLADHLTKRRTSHESNA